MPPSRLVRALVLAYGVFCYLAHWAAMVFVIGFFANLWPAHSIDGGRTSRIGAGLAVDGALLCMFVLPHWVMAQDSFKKRWTRVVPEPIERSTYVLVASALLAALCWEWRPVPSFVWEVGPPVDMVFRAGYWMGWLLAIGATFPINHWDLFGLRQVYLYWRGKAYTAPHTHRWWLDFIPHPIFVGYALAVWSTPRMTVGHLLSAVVLTAFLVIDVRLAKKTVTSSDVGPPM